MTPELFSPLDPPEVRVRGDWDRTGPTGQLRATCIQHPGRWHVAHWLTGDSADSAAKRARRGSSGWRGHEWEAVVRTVDGGRHLFVRCVDTAGPWAARAASEVHRAVAKTAGT